MKLKAVHCSCSRPRELTAAFPCPSQEMRKPLPPPGLVSSAGVYENCNLHPSAICRSVSTSSAFNSRCFAASHVSPCYDMFLPALTLVCSTCQGCKDGWPWEVSLDLWPGTWPTVRRASAPLRSAWTRPRVLRSSPSTGNAGAEGVARGKKPMSKAGKVLSRSKKLWSRLNFEERKV